MSHKATNWAISQRGLKPTSKLILWHLADCHNGHTSRCDPSQERIAYDCEISRASLNNHLSQLEERGLIRRQKRYDNENKTQQTTFYILGFDLPDLQNVATPVSKIETRKAVSKKTAKPSPKKAESRVQNLDTNLGREPGIEPCAEPRKDPVFSDLWKIYPRPRNELKTEELFNAAVTAGTDPNWIIRSARSYALEQTENDRKYIAYSDNWMEAERWQDFPQQTVEKEKIDSAVFWADAIKAGKYVHPHSMKAALLDEMLHRNLVTEDDLKARGINF